MKQTATRHAIADAIAAPCGRSTVALGDAVRMLVAISALVAAGSASASPLLQPATWLFGLYSAALFAFDLGARHQRDRMPVFWLDALWVLALFYLAGGATAFAPLLFVPVILAGACLTTRRSIMIGMTSALGTLAILALRADVAATIAMVTLPAFLLATGPLVSRLKSGARDDAAEDAAQEPDPDRGLVRLAADFLALACKAYGAKTGVLSVRIVDAEMRTFMTEADSAAQEIPAEGSPMCQILYEIAEPMLISSGRSAGRTPRSPVGEVEMNEAAETLSELVEAPYLLCATASARHSEMRLLLARCDRPFEPRALEQACRELRAHAPALDVAGLIEHLKAQVALMERLRLGRDLHDSAIQPYIGLKFAVEALARKLEPSDPIAGEVSRLLRMIQEELDALRNTMRGLRENRIEAVPLAQAIREQVGRLRELFGMDVELAVDENLVIDHALAAEILHMVSEALSNIRRHTSSKQAGVALSRDAEWLVLAVRNPAPLRVAGAPAFVPQSLSGRAAALGGYTSIQNDGGYTTVTVRLPLN